MNEHRIGISEAALADFCQRHHIQRMATFGSVLRDDFRPDSDIDFLIEFIPGHRLGFLTFAAIANELGDLLGRPVDLKTPALLSPYFRQQVLDEAETVYDAA